MYFLRFVALTTTLIFSKRKITNKCTTRFSDRVATFARYDGNDNDDDNRIFVRPFEDGLRRHFRRARSKFFRSKASQNSLVSGDDDAKLARLTVQFRGRDDVKKKEQDDKRKERSETRGRFGTRERKKKGGRDILAGIFTRSLEHPHPKVAPGCLLCVSLVHVYIYVCTLYIACVCTAWTCVKRDVAT